jgi:hypothetical protein
MGDDKPDRLDLVDNAPPERRIDLGHEAAKLREGHTMANANEPPKPPPPPTPGVKNIARPTPGPKPPEGSRSDE